MVFPFDRVHEGTRYRLKDLEKATIYHRICLERSATRKQIAAVLGSRPTTVSNVVHELIRDRLVVEGDIKERGKQGRPEIILHPSFRRLVALSVYVVSREIKGALIGLDGGMVARAEVELPPNAGNEAFADAVVGIVSELRTKKPAESDLLGVGISVTGSIDLSARKWHYTARWRNITDMDIGVIEERVGLPIVVNRLVNSRLEYLLLTNPDYSRGGTLLFHWGYGIGAAFAVDGEVMQSTFGSFAEVGHWKTAHGSPQQCLCGGVGCLETVAALWALAPKLASRYGQIPEDEVDFASFFCSRGLDSDELVVQARRQVANCLANLFMTLYPDRILMYGPFTESANAYDRVVEQIHEELPPFVRDHLRVAPHPASFDGDMAGGTHHLFRDALRTLLTANERRTAARLDRG